MTAEHHRPPEVHARIVETLERRYLRIAYYHGRAVDREPDLDAHTGEPVSVPLPHGIESALYDLLPDPPEAWTTAVAGWRGKTVGRRPTVAARARAGLPCEDCRRIEWYVSSVVSYCRACKQAGNRKRLGQAPRTTNQPTCRKCGADNWIRRKNGGRECRECSRRRDAAQRAKKREREATS